MSASDGALLEINQLRVEFSTEDGVVNAVQGIDLQINQGECLGIVGESGSGKSQAMHAVMGLLSNNGRASGSVRFLGEELLSGTGTQIEAIRGNQISMIFQDPLTSLTPHIRIGRQLQEVLERHQGSTSKQMRLEVEQALNLVRIPESRARMRQFPHELSGGMRQRVMIAMSILCNPMLLIADEPTTALDVTVQSEVLDIIRDLQHELSMAVVLISHDMGVVAGLCDRVAVMHKGVVVEIGSTDRVFYSPGEDYTKLLLSSMPKMDDSITLQASPVNDGPALQVNNLEVSFPVKISGGWLARSKKLRAVDGVSFELTKGETLGIVGESGCGKSTLARAVLRLLEADSGKVLWLGKDLLDADKQSLREQRKDLQIVFQDPLASLDPRMTIGDSIAEPLWTHQPLLTRAETNAKVQQMMRRVGLNPGWINRYPHEFSGGQNQRVGIARAMILKPGLVIADEAVSALDVTIQKQIVELLRDLQLEYGLSMLFISHDLSVVRQLSHRIMVLYMGRVVEIGPTPDICSHPQHPYTRALIDAVPRPDPDYERNRKKTRLSGDLPSPLDSRSGLTFLKSRLIDDPDARQYVAKLIAVSPSHYVAEHDPVEI
ncbi:MAG: peptide/nickel transport system ATP-binding protein [Halieaceae bacterium]|jgi:peptide/nickel transport system ATP-binding protein